MEILIEENYKDLSEKAAKIVKESIEKNPGLVLGLITGSTPLGLYEKLIDYYKEREIDFSQVTAFGLDEYLGLPLDHPQGYRQFLKENLIDKINLKEENFFIPSCKPKDLEKECKDYEKKINKKGGIDLQLLGVGRNGHIGFNEPGTSLFSRTHVSKLTQSTIKNNAHFFEKESKVPKKAITLGLQTIFESRRIVLLASGKKKAKICKRMIEGPVTSKVPASILQKHKKVTVILDKEAASLLEG